MLVVVVSHNHSQHNQATPHALLNSLVLLTMGIMMPETCWELTNQENKHHIVVTSNWFYYLPTLKMHGHTNIKLILNVSGNQIIHLLSKTRPYYLLVHARVIDCRMLGYSWVQCLCYVTWLSAEMRLLTGHKSKHNSIPWRIKSLCSCSRQLYVVVVDRKSNALSWLFKVRRSWHG